MKKLTALILGLVVVCAAALAGFRVYGQTTQPVPVAVFFQPARNLQRLADMGVTHAFGPEVENDRALTPDQLAAKRAEWVSASRAARLKTVLKNWTGNLPDNCVGVIIDGDELNGKVNPATGKIWQPADVAAEVARLRQSYPGIPVFASLAGDQVTNVKETNRDYAQQVAYYRAWGDLVDVLTVDNYPKNRNATRYPNTWPGDAVEKLAKFSGGKPVWVWLECNDQNLSPPTLPDVNREPTPDEIRQQAADCLARGAKGIGWFMTCQRGTYGWGDKGDGRGDSFFPMVNRAGASMAPQYAAVVEIGKGLAPQQPTPTTLPTTAPSVVDPVAARLDAMQGQLDGLRLQMIDNQRATERQIKAVADDLAKLPFVRLSPTTQPTGGN